MRSISILLLFLRLTSARLNATKATDLLEQLVDTQVAFNENFNVQIITSSNGSYSSPIQREIFDELQQRNKWPMKHFGFRAFPGDFTLGVGLRNEIHVVLLSPLGLKQVLKWGYGNNRLLADVFIYIGEENPAYDSNMKDTMNLAHLAIYGNSTARLRHLSHSYSTDGIRKWETKCILSSLLNNNCFKRPENVLQPPKVASLHLENLIYRYMIPLYINRNFTFHDMFTKIVIKNITKWNQPDDTVDLDLVGGIDLHLTNLLTRRFHLNFKQLGYFYNFSSTNPLAVGSSAYLLERNFADHHCSAWSLMGQYHMAFHPVPFFLPDFQFGVTFFTAPPLPRPAVEAVFATLQWHVWIALIGSFIMVLALLVKIHPNASFSDVATWMLDTLTSRVGADEIRINTISSGIVMYIWALAAIVLSYGFAGALISALSAPILIDPPKTWAELAESNYIIKRPVNPRNNGSFYGFFTLAFTHYAPEGSIYEKLGKRINETAYQYKKTRDLDGKFMRGPEYADEYKKYVAETPGIAVIFWADVNKYNQWTHNSSGDKILQSSDENSFPFHFDITLRRQFLYWEAFSIEIRHYWEMGLSDKWQYMENIEAPQKVITQFDYPPKVENTGPEPLNLDHIFGPAIFIVIALPSWFFVFMAELFWGRIMKKAKQIRVA